MLVFVTSLHIIALILLIWETVYAIKQTPSRIQVYLIIVTISTLIMLIGYMVEISTDNVAVALVGCAFSYIGKPFALMATTYFIIAYCGYKVPNWVTILLIVYSCIFPVLVFTNDNHHLYYSYVNFVPDAVFSGLRLGHGPMYPLYMITVIGYLIVDVIFVVIAFKRAKTRREYIHISYFCGIIASAMLGYLIYLTGITNGYDTTMAGCVFGSICLFLMFTRYRFFDVVALAKDRAIDEAHSGILVFNRDNRVEYKNLLMNDLLENKFTEDELIGLEDGENVRIKDDSVYLVKKKPVNKEAVSIGCIIEALDITDSFNYSQNLEREIEERTDELRHVQRGVIAGFTNIVEARDGKTGDHIKNTVKFVRMICDGLMEKGLYTDILTEKYADMLVDASPLHDIGKIAVSDTILLKPGRLSSEEFEIMKSHTTSGRDVIEKTMRGLESDAYVDMAKEVALYHHEKWIGGGYPEGLAGEDIPLCARIMAVADVYDALISERCYKKAMEESEAIEEIKKGIGTHFDPTVAEVFLEKL